MCKMLLKQQEQIWVARVNQTGVRLESVSESHSAAILDVLHFQLFCSPIFARLVCVRRQISDRALIGADQVRACTDAGPRPELAPQKCSIRVSHSRNQ